MPADTEPKTAENWLAALNVGDKAIQNAYGMDGRCTSTIKTITKITPTRIFVGENCYSKKDGKEVGGDIYPFDISPVTPERIAEIESVNTHKNAALKLSKVNWKELPSELLLTIINLVEKETGKTL